MAAHHAAHIEETPDPVVAYFLTEYETGKMFRHPDYEETRDMDVAQVDAYMHRPSGVALWQHAIDLRGGKKGPHAVVFHYTSSLGFANIANQAKTKSEVWASMLPKFSHFGKGIY